MPSPSIVPSHSEDVYLVLDDFGDLGRVWRETNEDAADRETVMRNLLAGEYSNPGPHLLFQFGRRLVPQFDS